MDRITEQTICHEWGHALMAFVLMGDGVIDAIEIVDTFEKIEGHTTIDYIKRTEQTNEQKVLILFAGISAERICKYSKDSFHYGKDDTSIRQLLPNKQERVLFADKAFNILSSYKNCLEKLVKETISRYPTERDNDNNINFRLFKDEIDNMIRKYI